MSDIETTEIKFTREALISEISRLSGSDIPEVVEEAGHMSASVDDLDSTGAPDAAYTPLLARAQSL